MYYTKVMIYYKDRAINAVIFGTRNEKYTNGTQERTKTEQHTYAHLIYDKVALQSSGKVICFNKLWWTNCI